MATITAVTSSDADGYLNVLDPATWVGGVVPGPGDIARFPNVTFSNYTSQYSNTPGHVHYLHPLKAPWTGSTMVPTFDTSSDYPVHIKCATTTLPLDNQHLSTSGSVYTFTYPDKNMFSPIKIDYQSKANNYFYSCSLNTSSYDAERPHGQWVNEPAEYQFDEHKTTGRLYYNNSVFFANMHRYELLGSWEVGKIEMGRGCDFKIHGDAYLTLVTTTVNAPEIDFVTRNGYHSTLRILDQATLQISGTRTTTDTTLGINLYRTGNTNILISGSANFSSSLLASSSLSADSKIYVADSSSFGIGDVISIESTGSLRHSTSNNKEQITYTATFDAQNIKGETGAFSEDSGHGQPSNDFLTDELVRVANIDTDNTITVKKYHTRYGYVHADLGMFDRQTYVETFDQTAPAFANTQRVVAVNSPHKSYTAGDVVVINNNAYTVTGVGTYLSQSQFIDFTNAGGDTPQDHLVWSPYLNSGSGYSTQDRYYSTHYFWDELFRKNTLFGSGSVQGDGGSFHIDTGSIRSFTPEASNSNKYTTYASLTAAISKSYWDEGEIIVSASIADTLYNDSGQPHNKRALVAIDWPCSNHLQLQGGPSREAVFDTIKPWDTATYGYSGAYGPFHCFANSRDKTTSIPINTFNDPSIIPAPSTFDSWMSRYNAVSSSFTTGSYHSSSSFAIKWERNGSHNKFYMRDATQETLYAETYQNQTAASVGIHIHEFAKVFSIEIKQRYQLLILDTTDSFSKNDDIEDGGLLYDHAADKNIKWIATEVEDALGYTNLLWDWYNSKGQSSILPKLQGFTYNNANYMNSRTYHNYLVGGYYENTADGVLGFNKPYSTGYFNAFWNNANSEYTIDLNTPVTFDTIGIVNRGTQTYGEGTGGTGAGYSNNQLTGVQIDVGPSSDTSTYTSFTASHDDDRRSSGKNAIRLYTTGSATTSQIIRIKTAGSTKLGTAAIRPSFFGVYNNPNKQLKLANVNNFKVGDHIFIYNKWPWHGHDQTAHSPTYNRIYPRQITNAADTDETVGGFRTTYEIMAIDTATNTITLDRHPVYTHITKGALIYKANRGNVRMKVNNPGRTTGGFNIYQNYGSHSKLIVKNAWIDGHNYSVNNGHWTHQWHEDCTFGAPNGGVATRGYADSLFFRNVLILGDALTSNYTSLNPYATKAFYNVFFGDQYSRNSSYYRDNGAVGYNFCTDDNVSGNYGIPGSVTVGNTMCLNNGLDKLVLRNHFRRGYYNAILRSYTLNTSYTMSNINQFKKTENVFFIGRFDSWSTGTGGQNYSKHVYSKLKGQAFKLGNDTITPNSVLSTPHRNALNGQNEMTDELNVHEGVLVEQNQLFNNKPTITIADSPFGIGLPYVIINEKTHFTLYKGQNTTFNNNAKRSSIFKRCVFNVNDDCDISISFNIDYQWSLMAALGLSREYRISVSGKIVPNHIHVYYQDTNVPRVVLIERSSNNPMGTVLDVEQLNEMSNDFTSYSYNKTFTCKKDHVYSFQIDWFNYAQYLQGMVLGKYKNVNFNIFTNNMSNIDVTRNTFDTEKQFISSQNDFNGSMPGSRNMGIIPVKRLTNDTGSFVRINNVKF